jgi:hypothetical protein
MINESFISIDDNYRAGVLIRAAEILITFHIPAEKASDSLTDNNTTFNQTMRNTCKMQTS